MRSDCWINKMTGFVNEDFGDVAVVIGPNG